MKCAECEGVVDADSPDADGWLRVTLDRRELSPVVTARGANLRTVQFDQWWLCSTECWILRLGRLVDFARLSDIEHDVDHVDELAAAVDEISMTGVTPPGVDGPGPDYYEALRRAGRLGELRGTVTWPDGTEQRVDER